MAGVVAAATAGKAEPLQLSLPVACEPGRTCFVQSFVDVDPGPGVRDWRCGAATYDGHTGLDIRVLSAAATTAGVAVVAAASGIVRTTRDGMSESLLTGARRADLMTRGCGNAVVIDHANGWQTTYCHLKPGSVRVRSAQKVERGEILGEMGFTGLAEFAHLHFDVRHNGKTVDPFLGAAVDGACVADGAAPPGGLWDDAAGRALAYRGGEFIQAGFAGAPVNHSALELDHAPRDAPGPDKNALVFFARAVNLQQGDRLRIAVNGPNGLKVESTSESMDRSKASYTAFAGRRRPADGWPRGVYAGRAEIVRNGGVVGYIEAAMTMP